MLHSREGERVLGGAYEVLSQVGAGAGDRRIELGVAGTCRFCRRRAGEATFRSVAHTFPEALGNRWIVSLDECDRCNALFSRYEGALADAVAPLLTLGGVRGKGGRIRQTGRSKGGSVLTRTEGGDRPHISLMAAGHDLDRVASVDPATGRLVLRMPIAGVPFRPRDAYKALCKMAFALLPAGELERFGQLRSWLQAPADPLDFPFLDVGLSMASVGNAPALAVGTLLRRVDPTVGIPYMLFVLAAGSACLQIDLMPDHMDDHLPPTGIGAVNIRWTNVVSAGDGRPPLTVDYGHPVHLDWAGAATEPQPIAEVLLRFDTRTTEADLVPVVRNPVLRT